MSNRQSQGGEPVPIGNAPVPEPAEGGPVSNLVCHIAAFVMVAALRLAAHVIAIGLACAALAGRGAVRRPPGPEPLPPRKRFVTRPL
jgi:hypothetical protein